MSTITLISFFFLRRVNEMHPPPPPPSPERGSLSLRAFRDTHSIASPTRYRVWWVGMFIVRGRDRATPTDRLYKTATVTSERDHTGPGRSWKRVSRAFAELAHIHIYILFVLIFFFQYRYTLSSSRGSRARYSRRTNIYELICICTSRKSIFSSRHDEDTSVS